MASLMNNDKPNSYNKLELTLNTKYHHTAIPANVTVPRRSAPAPDAVAQTGYL